MANVDKAFGLRPYKGAGWPVQQANKYNISPASGYGTSSFQGDLCIFNGGYIERAAASSANIVGVFSHTQTILYNIDISAKSPESNQRKYPDFFE